MTRRTVKRGIQGHRQSKGEKIESAPNKLAKMAELAYKVSLFLNKSWIEWRRCLKQEDTHVGQRSLSSCQTVASIISIDFVICHVTQQFIVSHKKEQPLVHSIKNLELSNVYILLINSLTGPSSWRGYNHRSHDNLQHDLADGRMANPLGSVLGHYTF